MIQTSSSLTIYIYIYSRRFNNFLLYFSILTYFFLRNNEFFFFFFITPLKLFSLIFLINKMVILRRFRFILFFLYCNRFINILFYDVVLFIVLLRRFICLKAIQTSKIDLIDRRYQIMVDSILNN